MKIVNGTKIYTSEKEVVWIQFEDRLITEYPVIGETSKKYMCVVFNHNFFVSKDKCFDTKDDLMFDNFTKVCLAKMKSKRDNLNKSKRYGHPELLRYLGATKQKEYSERFAKEYAEYLI